MKQEIITNVNRTNVVDLIIEKLDSCQEQLKDSQEVIISINNDEILNLNVSRSEIMDELVDSINTIFEDSLVFDSLTEVGDLIYKLTDFGLSIQSALRYLKTCVQDCAYYVEEHKYLLVTCGEDQLLGEISEIEKCEIEDAEVMVRSLFEKYHKINMSYCNLKKLYVSEPF